MVENKGKASRAVVGQLITDMNDFSNYVKNELHAILGAAKNLGEFWRDPQYDQFISFVNDLTASLKKDLFVFDEAADALQKKLNKYN